MRACAASRPRRRRARAPPGRRTCPPARPPRATSGAGTRRAAAAGRATGAAAAISSFASARLHDPRVVLEQHAAQLPRRLERRERLAELAERGLAVGLLVPGHRGARLRVPGEAVRRALGPLRSRLRRGKAVERRVDLDGVEALGVVGEPRGRRGHSARVPVLDEALVGPRARADPDHGHAVKVKERAPARALLSLLLRDEQDLRGRTPR